jgi:organic radical activating enzyme
MPMLQIDTIISQFNELQNNVNSAINSNINWRSDRLFNALIRTSPKATLTSVVISLVEHCNLRCRGCDHCAPLAEETFLDVKVFEKDMHRLAELSGGDVGVIKLMGGEPLLHPDIHNFTKIARRYFQESRIEITTNGILLIKQQDSFWENCHNNNITIVATKYPLKIKWDVIKDKAKSHKVLFEYYGNSEKELKTSYHIPFDINGTRDTAENFVQCFHANNCRELYHGRLYTCTVLPHAKHFVRVFDIKLNECSADSIDIYDAKNMTEILEFLAKPIPFCRYCNVPARTWGHLWQQSKKEIEEWTVQ